VPISSWTSRLAASSTVSPKEGREGGQGGEGGREGDELPRAEVGEIVVT